MKWTKTSITLIEDFKYLNLRLPIFQLKTSNKTMDYFCVIVVEKLPKIAIDKVDSRLRLFEIVF